MTRSEAVRAAAAELTAAGVPSAMRDAQVMMAEVLGSSLALRSDPDLALDAAQAERFSSMIEARKTRRPVSQIIGWREFYGRRFIVTEAVLDPRPETEELVALALSTPARRILDLGTGTGAIALTLLAEWSEATAVASDLSADALDVARRNADALGVADRVTFVQGPWFEPVEGQFDLIVSNPPYITQHEMTNLSPEVQLWEPQMALTPGGDGLAPYRDIATDLLRYLTPDGRAYFEIGITQGADVMAILRDVGCSEVGIHSDLTGRDRIVAVKHLKTA